MYKLLPIVIISFILAALSERTSYSEIDSRGMRHYVYKDRIFFALLTVCMAIFIGLRTAGNDTYAYRMMFENIPKGSEAYKSIQWTRMATAPGFVFVSTVLKHIGCSNQDFIMLFGSFTVCIYMWFLRKYTGGIWLTIFYFITMGPYTFCLAAIKQTAAVAFLLIATDRAITRKYIGFIFWVVIAELFHPYAFVYLVVPFVAFSPWKSQTYLLMFGTIVVALSLSRFLGTILEITETLGADYDENAFTGAGVNAFRVIVVWVPVVLSFIARRRLKKSHDRVQNVIINLSMVNAMIMFVGLFGTANYFARLANYFLVFQVLALPYLLQNFVENDRRFLRNASIVGFTLYFYYAQVIANGRFDNVYRFTTLPEYLRQLL